MDTEYFDSFQIFYLHKSNKITRNNPTLSTERPKNLKIFVPILLPEGNGIGQTIKKNYIRYIVCESLILYSLKNKILLI